MYKYLLYFLILKLESRLQTVSEIHFADFNMFLHILKLDPCVHDYLAKLSFFDAMEKSGAHVSYLDFFSGVGDLVRPYPSNAKNINQIFFVGIVLGPDIDP
jgi:hypothetical protein